MNDTNQNAPDVSTTRPAVRIDYLIVTITSMLVMKTSGMRVI